MMYDSWLKIRVIDDIATDEKEKLDSQISRRLKFFEALVNIYDKYRNVDYVSKEIKELAAKLVEEKIFDEKTETLYNDKFVQLCEIGDSVLSKDNKTSEKTVSVLDFTEEEIDMIKKLNFKERLLKKRFLIVYLLSYYEDYANKLSKEIEEMYEQLLTGIIFKDNFDEDTCELYDHRVKSLLEQTFNYIHLNDSKGGNK